MLSSWMIWFVWAAYFGIIFFALAMLWSIAASLRAISRHLLELVRIQNRIDPNERP